MVKVLPPQNGSSWLVPSEVSSGDKVAMSVTSIES